MRIVYLNASKLTDAEIRSLGWQALVEKLGSSGAVRFAIQTERGFGDYAESRHRALGAYSVDELLAQLQSWKKRRSGRAPRREK